jgi:hypothetical protein
MFLWKLHPRAAQYSDGNLNPLKSSRIPSCLRWNVLVCFGKQQKLILSLTVRYSELKILFHLLNFHPQSTCLPQVSREIFSEAPSSERDLSYGLCNGLSFTQTTMLCWWQQHIVVVLSPPLYHLSALFARLLLRRENSPFHANFMTITN